MLYLIVYDIEDNRVRQRVASLLEGYGRRVQESVFECRLEKDALAELTERLGRELREEANGQIRLYRVCGSCLEASFGLGDVKSVDTGACYIV